MKVRLENINDELNRQRSADPDFNGTPFEKELLLEWNTTVSDLYAKHPKTAEINRLETEISLLEQGNNASRFSPTAGSFVVSQMIDAKERELDLAWRARDVHIDMYIPGERHNIGDYMDAKTGVCRHQAVAAQVLLQGLGLDSRLTVGAAVDGENGNYRGPHMWLEITLSNGAVYRFDPTWDALDRIKALQDIKAQERPLRTRNDFQNSTVAIGNTKRNIA